VLAAVRDSLALKHIPEHTMEKRVSTHTIIFPAEAEDLWPDLASGDLRPDAPSELWDMYQVILERIAT
jgi:hypothetical protein